LRERGVYLITGGLGGIGLELAEYLARTVQAKLVLVGRSGLPPRGEWSAWLEASQETDGISRRIRKVRALEELGAEVLVLRADVSDRRQMEEVFRGAEARFGTIHGVIHAAGVAGGGVIELKTREEAERVLAPKMRGTLVLDVLLRDRKPDFLVLCSSLASIMGGPGRVDYCAANVFMDSMARRNAAGDGVFTVSVNWDTWREAGMAVDASALLGFEDQRRERIEEGILSREGTEAFDRILRQKAPQILVSSTDVGQRTGRAAGSAALTVAHEGGRDRPHRVRHQRPELASDYVAPRNDVEQAVVEAWQELLGFERVGVHDNFFDLGGHSLLATQIANRLRETFGVRLNVEGILEAATVAELSRTIIESETKQGQAEEIARIARSIERMSTGDMLRILHEEKASGGGA
jgi:NAD(P)-dependent dehydrogenase (short-subunit alcohol dehydrogenase family)/acyl carrier protein